MNNGQRRLVVLPSAIDREESGQPSPHVALRRLLASHPHAPGLLSEARHWQAVVRDSVAAATQALRSARDSELACELARRKADPRGVRSLRFWAAAAVLGGLLAVCAAAALLLAWGLPWPEPIAFACVAALLGGVAAWIEGLRGGRPGPGAGRRGLSTGYVLGVLGLCVILMAVHVFTAPGPLLLRAAAGAGLGLVLGAAMLAGVFVLGHAESWQCLRLRRASALVARHRRDMLGQVSADESCARAALAAWESLVVEECQLAHPDHMAGGAWLAECLAAARGIATPAGLGQQ